MKPIALLLALILLLSPLALAEAPAPVYALVVKDQGNPYMQKLYEGFKSACQELGATPLLAGPDAMDTAAQAEAIDGLAASGVQGIAVTVSDEGVTAEPLKSALHSGIPVVSVDSATVPESRLLHIQQVDPTLVSRALMQAARRMISGSGQAAILSTSEAMPNQSAWVRLMLQEVAQYEAEYAYMPIVEVAYGQDDAEASARETERLLDTYPDLKIIIAPTSVGLRAAAGVIEARGADVLVTGLGLPSDMAPYIQSGACPWMYLWNPIDMGYLAACALDALAQGTLTGTEGESFTAGRIGERIITKAQDGGTEIVAGNPYKFDKNNILSWQNAF